MQSTRSLHLLGSWTTATIFAGCHTGGDRLALLEQRVARLETLATHPAPEPAPSIPLTPPPPTTPPPGLVFEQDGWVLSGGGRDVYDVRPDPAVRRNGHGTMLLAPLRDTGDRYGTLMRATDASPYRGKRVRVSAYTKTEGTSQRVDFWARVQAVDSPSDGSGLGGGGHELPTDSDWTRQELVFDVPAEGHRIEYGVGIAGPGRMWIDEPKLEVVGPDVPVTRVFPGEQTVGDWLMTGVGAPEYALSQDAKAVRLDAKTDGRRFVHLLRVVAAAPHVGKKVKLSLEMKATSDESVLCVAKVLTTPQWTYGASLALGTQQPSEDRSARFVPCDMTLDVPEGAKWILFGVGAEGTGQLWVRGGTVTAAPATPPK